MDVKKIKEYCELILTLSVCLYLLGFIIVSSYFVQYGFFPEEFVSVKYISASILFIFSISIFLLGISAIKQAKDNGKYIIDIKEYKFFAIIIYTTWVCLFGAKAFNAIYFTSSAYLMMLNIAIVGLILIPYFIYAKIKDKSKVSILLLPQAVFIYFFLQPEFQWFIMSNILFVYTAVRLRDRINKKDTQEIGLIKKNVPYFMFIIVIIVNAIVFGGIIYPLMPRYLGGGEPLTVSLLINSEKQKSFEKIGLKIEENGWTNNQKLLYKSPTSLYLENVQPLKFSCIEIKNDTIEAIRYIGGYKKTFFEMMNLYRERGKIE